MQIHFIAIGGSAMHNLALALHHKGYTISGSDDEIFEPSKTRLKNHGLLPEVDGWFPEKITKNTDAVILGMHARKDNPELERAKELGIKVFSYPEYIYEQTKNKIRVVIGGSHGKTSITAMILHVLDYNKINCDYMVGAQLEGFDTMVKLSKEAPIAILEGDEYLSSPIDRRPKFHLYKPNIALLSGIAWDHINVFPTFDNYVEQFKIFIDLIEKDGTIIYCESDSEVKKVCEASKEDLKKIPYNIPEHTIVDGTTYLTYGNQKVPLQVFGDHNLMNINGAKLVCFELGVNERSFYEAINSFNGASRRLELIIKDDSTAVYRDFAHSPSKLKATTEAVKKQFPQRKLIACMELHTFSSLNETFLMEYNGAMLKADEAIVYYSPHTIAHKKLAPISIAQVKKAFGGNNISVFVDSSELVAYLLKKHWKDTNLLLMTSGNFDGIDFKSFSEKIMKKEG
ncbi:MAG: peptidoglycan synthetase [Bacteroidetes bacterium]|nr:peptidoglycan synthetase [Bacteroidota bacterium]HET6243061.1 Mur ligase family protein [Bacteroidia bacterium]